MTNKITTPGQSIAKRGYRVLPGTAVHQQGHARFGEAPTDLPPPRYVRDAMEKAQMAGPVPPSCEPKLVIALPAMVKLKGKRK